MCSLITIVVSCKYTTLHTCNNILSVGHDFFMVCVWLHCIKNQPHKTVNKITDSLMRLWVTDVFSARYWHRVMSPADK